MAFGSLVLELTDTSELAGPWQGGCLGLSWSKWPQRFIQTCPLCPQPCLDCTARSALKAMTRGNRRWLVLQGDKLTQTREMGHGRDWGELESNASLERHSNLTCSEVLWTANRTQLWSRSCPGLLLCDLSRSIYDRIWSWSHTDHTGQHVHSQPISSQTGKGTRRVNRGSRAGIGL